MSWVELSYRLFCVWQQLYINSKHQENQKFIIVFIACGHECLWNISEFFRFGMNVFGSVMNVYFQKALKTSPDITMMSFKNQLNSLSNAVVYVTNSMNRSSSIFVWCRSVTNPCVWFIINRFVCSHLLSSVFVLKYCTGYSNFEYDATKYLLCLEIRFEIDRTHIEHFKNIFQRA